MRKNRRIPSHVIESITTNKIHSIIDASRNGLYREISGRDYGIDAIVEKFDNGCITGKICFIQCKGQNDIIKPLKTAPDFVSCKGISSSNLDYALQNNTLVILTFTSANDDIQLFYFIDLRTAVTEQQLKNNKNSITVRIPVRNNSNDNINGFWKLIDDFYDN